MSAMLLAGGSRAAVLVENGHLTADGMLKVKGMPVAGSRLVMVEHDGAVVVLDHGLEHFSLTLKLNSEYLMEFTHEGCVTKQVLFDTRVPTGDFIFRDYQFPFEVTLQAPPKGQEFTYAGPVGRVYFNTATNDFSYDTDYRAQASKALVNAMAQANHAPAPVAKAPSLPAPEVPDGARHTEREAPLVHLTGGSLADVPLEREAPPLMLVVRAPAVRTAPLASRTPRVSIRPRSAVNTPDMVRQPRAPATAPTMGLPLAADDQREEELIIEKLRVIKVVRLTEAGHVTEYRRVENSYGPVYYFCDGQSCSQFEYDHNVGVAPQRTDVVH